MISAQAKEDGTFNAAVDDASNLDPAYREFKSCDGQHFYEPRRRAEFERERPTGGQFTHEPGGILADEMGLGKTVVVAARLPVMTSFTRAHTDRPVAFARVMYSPRRCIPL